MEREREGQGEAGDKEWRLWGKGGRVNVVCNVMRHKMKERCRSSIIRYKGNQFISFNISALRLSCEILLIIPLQSGILLN